jgi:hypothetical protein
MQKFTQIAQENLTHHQQFLILLFHIVWLTGIEPITCTCIKLHVECAQIDRQTSGINHSNHSEEHARVIPFTATATAAHTLTAHSIIRQYKHTSR